MSVDPYMQARMNDASSPYPAVPDRGALDGRGQVRLIAAGTPALRSGRRSLHGLGLAGEYAVVKGPVRRPRRHRVRPSRRLPGRAPGCRRPDPARLVAAAEFRRNDAVFVSVRRARSARSSGEDRASQGRVAVIGSAPGRRQRSARLRQTRLRRGVRLPRQGVADRLRRQPDGIDVYFDNVGGAHLEAAIERMKRQRADRAGKISAYNATRAPCAPGNLTPRHQLRT